MTRLVGWRRAVVIMGAIFALAASLGTLVVHVSLGLVIEGVHDFSVTTAATAMTLATVSLIGLHRQPTNHSLHIALTASVLMGLELAGQVVGLPIVAGHVGEAISPITEGNVAPADVPTVAQWALWFTATVWLPGMILALSVMFLRFPDGDLISRRWRLIEWSTIAGITLATLGMAIDWSPGSTTPYSTDSFETSNAALASAGWGLILVGVVGSIASLGIRYRRADQVVRHQLRWVALPMSVGATVAVLYVPIDTAQLAWISLLLVPAIFVGYGFAVTRYRLFDIDIVLNRTIVFGALATSITAVYVAIVVGVGSIVGDPSNLGLAITATAVVAIVFEPLRGRVQHAANLLVYGERATPYEVLSGMTEGTTEVTDLLPRATALLGEGTGANSVAVFRRVGDRLEAAWCWPEDDGFTPLPLVGELAAPGADITRPLIRDDEVVGAVALAKPRGEPLRATDVRLVEEFAGQAGVLVASIELTRQLQARAVELAASRRRLVTAQDDARRRLERDVHDGAQQNLVALKVKLGMARSQATKEGADDVAGLIAALIEDADVAVDDLRRLARGIYPPLLEAEGLGAALRAQARLSSVPVDVDDATGSRYGRDVEATVYFCVLEALQNVVKHADARACNVTIDERTGMLCFTVTDDGTGFDSEATEMTGIQGMRDRLDAIGGSLRIESEPGLGTTLTGTVPIPPAVGRDQFPDMAASNTDGSNSSLETNATAPASTAPVS